MTKLYLALVLAVEATVMALLSFEAGLPMLLLAPVLPLTLAGALFLHHLSRSPAYWARRLSPEGITRHRGPEEVRADTPEELSHRIVERADEIHCALLESPSEVQVEMCALGYRACVNDMITLTHLINDEMKTAGPLKRLKLHAARKRATDSLNGAREAMPPDVLRATRQEHQ